MRFWYSTAKGSFELIQLLCDGADIRWRFDGKTESWMILEH